MFITFVRWRLSVGIKRFTYLLTYICSVIFFVFFCTTIFFQTVAPASTRRPLAIRSPQQFSTVANETDERVVISVLHAHAID